MFTHDFKSIINSYCSAILCIELWVREFEFHYCLREAWWWISPQFYTNICGEMKNALPALVRSDTLFTYTTVYTYITWTNSFVTVFKHSSVLMPVLYCFPRFFLYASALRKFERLKKNKVETSRGKTPPTCQGSNVTPDFLRKMKQ